MKAFISPFCCNNCLAHAPFSLGRRIEKSRKKTATGCNYTTVRLTVVLIDGFKSHGINPVEVYCIFMGVNNSNQSSVTLLNSGGYDSEIPISICLLVADICKYVSSAFSWLISSGVFFSILVCLFCSTLWRYSPFSLYLEFGRFFLPRFLYLCSTKLVSEAIIHFTIEPCEFCQFS